MRGRGQRARSTACCSSRRCALETVAELNEGLVCLSGCARDGLALRDPQGAARLAAAFGRERFFVELQRPYERGDTRRHLALRHLAEHLGVETVATGNVHAHSSRRTLLQDVLVAIRCRTSLDGCERERRGNREAVLRAPGEMVERFAGVDRAAAERTVAIAERLTFDLTAELGYRYPDFSDRADPATRQLAAICEHAFGERYGACNDQLRARARARLESELALIGRLELAGFFLLHHEVLELARECALEVRGRDSPRMFLPPGRGRGSSVGSIVCYLTGLSHVDPVENDLSLGRFLNEELAAVPDIDLDFPRDIREKLIVRVTERYGHEHAALVASFATYRSRGAIRDVGKALGLPHSELERLARVTDGWSAERVADEVAELPDADRKLLSKRWRAFRFLTAEIARLPRHVSQHPGGMVISSRPLIELVPVQPAAMAGRQLCQWDKDSCADAGFLKIDLLGLGMLSCIEECVDRIAQLHGAPIDLSRIPLDDPAVFAEIQAADTVGTFQIESRAQMQSLLRTKPETIDDLTIQVALVRPGPIQGKAVHPYIEHRRRLREDPSFVFPVPHESLREPLASTLGVVVFQDQVLDVAIALAGFTIGEAEGLRRAMSRKRSHEALEGHRVSFVEGAVRKGIAEEVADGVFDTLVGFSGFGFPKAHAAAFGLLAYQSAWLRHHYPAEFLCGLLNEQPMGFYPPASLVRDAQRRGVEVRSPDVNLSGARCGLEPGDGAASVVRLQSTQVVTLSASGSRTSRRWGRTTRRRSRRNGMRTGPTATSAISPAGRRSPATRSRHSSAAARATASGRGVATSSGSSASRRDPGRSRARAARRSSFRSPSTRPQRPPTCPTSLAGSACSPTTGRRASRSARIPLTLLRPHLPEGTLSSPELHEQRHGTTVAYAGPRDRAAAAGDREGDRLHAARGRARPGEPHRPEGRLRASPGDRPRRAAPPRARPLRARRAEPERPRPRAREPLGARPPGGREPRRRGRASARPPFRSPLAACR